MIVGKHMVWQIQLLISINLIRYGKFKPSQRAINSDFISSLSTSTPTKAQPSVATWLKTTDKYYQLSNSKKPSTLKSANRTVSIKRCPRKCHQRSSDIRWRGSWRFLYEQVWNPWISNRCICSRQKQQICLHLGWQFRDSMPSGHSTSPSMDPRAHPWLHPTTMWVWMVWSSTWLASWLVQLQTHLEMASSKDQRTHH